MATTADFSVAMDNMDPHRHYLHQGVLQTELSTSGQKGQLIPHTTPCYEKGLTASVVAQSVPTPLTGLRPRRAVRDHLRAAH
jgi:hypothetical protein